MSNKITPGKYDIYQKLLDISSNYIEDYDNVDFLKTGLFGYITESLAMIMRDSAMFNSMIYKESFLNTAVMPKSIYNWAKLFNVEVTQAFPSHANIDIKINTKDLGNYINSLGQIASGLTYYGTDVTNLGNSKVLIIDKNKPILAGEYYFHLEHSIVIYRTSGGAFLAKYILTERETTSYQVIKSQVLKTISRNGILIIQARAYQYNINRITRNISSVSFLSSKAQTFKFNDQFAGAKLYYSEGNEIEEIQLKYGTVESLGEKYVEYDIINNNEIELKFSLANGNFVPAVNSNITLFIFTTKGSDIPGEFSEIALFQSITGNYASTPIGKGLFQIPNSIPFTVAFNPTIISRGIDAPDLSNIKQRIISDLSTRNVLVTESDLNNYFSLLRSLIGSVSDGNITFIKKRDDILKRVFGAYVLLRDGKDSIGNETGKGHISRVIPTNTIDADFKVTSDMSRPFGSTIVLKDDDSSEYNYVPNPINVNDAYIVPFFMRIMLNPLKRVKYIYNLTDEYSQLIYDTVNNLPSEAYLSPVDMSVTRGIEGSSAAKNYEFKFNFTSNISIEINETTSPFTLMFTNPSSPLDKTEIAIDNDDITITNTDIGDGNLFSVTATINLQVADVEFDFSNPESDTYGSNINLIYNDKIYSLPEEVLVSLKNDFKATNTSSNFNFTSISNNVIRLFRNLDDIMSSNIDINVGTYYKDEITGKYHNEDTDPSSKEEVKLVESVTIRDIPVVHKSFFKDDILSQTKFISQLFSYIDILKENREKLESSTHFDLKFYNTHGLSKLYDTVNTNIDLEMTVYLKNVNSGFFDNVVRVVKTDILGTQSGFMESIRPEIQDFIRRIVDDSNKNGTVRVSEIISKVSRDDTYGPYIDRIEFEGMNKTFNQVIKKVKRNNVHNITPEWLNIDAVNISNIKFEIDN